MNPLEIEIAGRKIGAGHPVYIIAEMSGNHGQSLDRAIELIWQAKESGADAVKLQTYTPDTLTIDCDKPHFRITGGTNWDGRTLYDLYGEACTPWEWTAQLQGEAKKAGITLFSTPFDASAVEFLESLDMPAYKIASFELIDLPLLECVARTGKPVILSTGMATKSEINEAVITLGNAGCSQLALLKCSSAYPAPHSSVNLATVAHMEARFGIPAGFSDHTTGIVAPVVAATHGARILEKHFTLSREDGGPDATFSLEPNEFAEMVQAVRDAELCLGQPHYGATEHEEKSRIFRRSLYVVETVSAGEPFTPENVRSIRPGNGMHPRRFSEILHRTATRDIERGTPLSDELVA